MELHQCRFGTLMTRTTSYFYAILIASLPGTYLFAQDEGVYIACRRSALNRKL